MGSGASIEENLTLAFSAYARQRKKLRKSLVAAFKEDPKNFEALAHMQRMKEVVTMHPSICKTARLEASTVFEPTCLSAVQLEFLRLKQIYEKHLLLKSVVERRSFVACPLGHRTIRIDNGKCSNCSKEFVGGFRCDYCDYLLCDRCSFIYCPVGHPMILWTHPESQQQCFVCKEESISSGYQCQRCVDCNICDLCTRLEKRIELQLEMHAEIKETVDFMAAHTKESTVAEQMVAEHQKDVAESIYFTTVELLGKRTLYRRLKDIVRAQVGLYRHTTEILRLRQLIGRDAWVSATARRELAGVGHFTAKEITRLRRVIEHGEYMRSAPARSRNPIACPLGHTMKPYEGCPDTYIAKRQPKRRKTIHHASSAMFTREASSVVVLSAKSEICENKLEDSDNELEPEAPEDGKSVGSNSYTNRTGQSHLEDLSDSSDEEGNCKVYAEKKYSLKHPPNCMICSRLAKTGFHCSVCEYDLCDTCSSIYCHAGHPMKLFTAPGERYTCSFCGVLDLEAGYACLQCKHPEEQPLREPEEKAGNMLQLFAQRHQHEEEARSQEHYVLCDRCTAADRRALQRERWEKEIEEILEFMRHFKSSSDIAKFYHWQRKVFIVSVAILVEHVCELRRAKERAQKQIRCKLLIHRIKELRKVVTANPGISALSARELQRELDYVFDTDAEALAEIDYYQGLIDAGESMKRQQPRSSAGFACPLGHATFPIAERPRYYAAEVEHSRRKSVSLSRKSQKSSTKQNDHAEENNFPILETEMVDAQDNVQPLATPPVLRFSSQNKFFGDGKADVADHGLDGEVDCGQSVSELSFATIGNRSAFASANQEMWQLEDLNGSPDSPAIAKTAASYPEPSKVEGSRKGRSVKSVASSIGPESSVDFGAVDGFIPADAAAPFVTCKVCDAEVATAAGCAGMWCKLCDYSVCGDCSVVYCRQGHALRIWTFPEAQFISCSVCYKNPLTLGYRCMQCELDICDMCTCRERQEEQSLWPRRESFKIFEYIVSVSQHSHTARQVIAGQLVDVSDLLHKHRTGISLLEGIKVKKMSLSAAARQLNELRRLRATIQTEVQLSMRAGAAASSPKKNRYSQYAVVRKVAECDL